MPAPRLGLRGGTSFVVPAFHPLGLASREVRELREESPESLQGYDYRLILARSFLARSQGFATQAMTGTEPGGISHESHESHEESPERPQGRAFRPILMTIVFASRAGAAGKREESPGTLVFSASEASHSGGKRRGEGRRRHDRRTTKIGVISRYFNRYRRVTNAMGCDRSCTKEVAAAIVRCPLTQPLPLAGERSLKMNCRDGSHARSALGAFRVRLVGEVLRCAQDDSGRSG